MKSTKDKGKQLPKANKQLVGKIQDEVSLYYSGPNNDKMHQHFSTT